MDERYWRPAPSYLASAEADGESGSGGGNAAAGGDAAHEALERSAAEQLLDDEKLRGDLTDDEYSPLQAWALDQLHARIMAIASPDTPEAETEVEHAVADLRQVLEGISTTIGQRLDLDAQQFTDGLAAIRKALDSSLYGAEGPAVDAQGALESLMPELAARKDVVDGVDLVTALVAALRGESTAVGGEDTRA